MIIYLITNKINNKMYVGLTTKTLEKRWKGHCMKSANKMMIEVVKEKHIRVGLYQRIFSNPFL